LNHQIDSIIASIDLSREKNEQVFADFSKEERPHPFVNYHWVEPLVKLLLRLAD